MIGPIKIESIKRKTIPQHHVVPSMKKTKEIIRNSEREAVCSYRSSFSQLKENT